MKEITRIRLAKIAYDIDVDAKQKLGDYITNIKKSLGDDSDIYEDIEIRMTEILSDLGVETQGVITNNEVESIINQLGQPADFANGEQPVNETSDDMVTDKNPTMKRYYRDTDNALAGGVIAGLAAYTGIDVTLLRLIYVGLGLISFGAFFVLYIILWFIAPAAKTVGEKLEMQGKSVDLNSIKEQARQFKDEAANAGENLKGRVKGLKVADTINKIGSIIVRILMVLLGAFISFLAICGIMTALVSGIIAITAAIQTSGTGVIVLATVLTMASAIAFFVFLVSVSTMLITKKASRRLNITAIAGLAISVVLICTALISGLVWTGIIGAESASETTMNVVEIIDNRFRLY